MKKLSMLVLSLVLVLGSLGVAYAAWSQGLTVQGTVKTGFISASFNDASLETRPYATYSFDTINSGYQDALGNFPDDVLAITLNDVYPGYHQNISFNVKNNGTVPFFLRDAILADVVVKDGWGNVVTNVINIEIIPANDFIEVAATEPGAISGVYTFQLQIPGVDSTQDGDWVDPIQHHTYTVTMPLVVEQQHVA